MKPKDVPTVPDAGDDDENDLPSRLGHFEIVGRLGVGGMGLVFEGRDAMLDRRVALKLLHPNREGNPIAPARLLREAQALAKLKHPNVVTVYEVGMAGDEPFVAMELVEGQTLAEWMKEPRDWRTVLGVFIAVGHGLAAVHELGLVHRDFKPSNVLFDKTGVPKLGDFGLVRPVDESESGAAFENTSLTTTLTQTGGVMGTPAYMAPEQRLGLRVDARADQFSFAKTLREALSEPIPAKLQPILARAMAEEPGDRYPAMAELLEELARVRRGNRARWIAAGGTGAVVGAIALAWGFGRSQAGDACLRPSDRIEKVWGPGRRGALEAHLVSIDPALGAQRFAAAARVLDRGAAYWADQHVEACETARAGRSSDSLLDRRMACLDRALLEIDNTVAVLERATDRVTLDDAVKAVVGLPGLDDCADTNALTELLPRPVDPARRAEADALTRETVEIDVAVRTGGTKSPRVTERATAALTRARALGDPETLARSLRSLAGVQLENEAGVPTLATLREAITAASTAHDDRMVAELWSKLLSTLVAVKRPDEAQTLMSAAEAAVARTKSSTELTVTFLDTKAAVALANNDVAHAKEYVENASKVLDDAGAQSPTSPLRPLLITIKGRAALLYYAAKDWTNMAGSLRETIRLANAQFGPDHATLALLHYRLGVAMRNLGDKEASIAAYREAVRVGEARLGPSPGLANYLFAVSTALVIAERNDEAIPILERAVRMARDTLPAGDPRLADSVGTLAAAYMNSGRVKEAKPFVDEEISIYEKSGREDRLAVAYFNRGEWGRQMHQCGPVMRDLDRSAILYAKTGTPLDVLGVLVSVADCQLDLRDFAAAIQTAERIMASPDGDAGVRAAAKATWGKAKYALGDKRAVAEVRAARDELVKAGDSKTVKDLDTWLANPR